MFDKVELLNKIDKLFESDCGKKVLSLTEDAISDYSMHERLSKGVLVGLSGGSDSVLLLLVLYRLREKYQINSLCTVHVNHGIRGEEAERDELFAKEFCDALGIEFFSYRADVPALAKERSVGLEEAARDARYALFREHISKHGIYKNIATAHNATDNLETIIFNLARGSGTKGIAGISPIRDDVIRPLIYVPKELVVKTLDEAGIDFVTDSTNSSCEYTRNYIRHEIIPTIKHINNSVEYSATRLSRALREDSAYLDSIAKCFFDKNYTDKAVLREALCDLPSPILSRVIIFMAQDYGSFSLESVHINEIKKLLIKESDFSIDIPGKLSFACRGGVCCIEKKDAAVTSRVRGRTEIKMGVNHIEDFDCVILLSENKREVFYSNVYKISIQASLSSAIILDNLYVRSKEDGDAYYYGGMTRKLKKLFNDRKIPPEERENIPILCDKNGVVWVPGFSARDDIKGKDKMNNLWVTLYKK